MTTNREKLAKMTNEELAKFLSKDKCLSCIYSNLHDCFLGDCQNGILKWLSRESEG